jgi:hypothetical protein
VDLRQFRRSETSIQRSPALSLFSQAENSDHRTGTALICRFHGLFLNNAYFYGNYAEKFGMRRRSASRGRETVPSIKQTISSLKVQIPTLGYCVGPIIGLLVAFVVGFFNPHAFENDYFVILILFFGIFWMLFYGAGPLKNDAVDNGTAIEALKPSALRSENEVR